MQSPGQGWSCCGRMAERSWEAQGPLPPPGTERHQRLKAIGCAGTECPPGLDQAQTGTVPSSQTRKGAQSGEVTGPGPRSRAETTPWSVPAKPTPCTAPLRPRGHRRALAETGGLGTGLARPRLALWPWPRSPQTVSPGRRGEGPALALLPTNWDRTVTYKWTPAGVLTPRGETVVWEEPGFGF